MKTKTAVAFLGLSLVFLLIFSSNSVGQAKEFPAIDWTHYHTYAETTDLLRMFAQTYPELCKLYSIGKSFQGKDIWCLEITQYASGLPEHKPGMYIDGNTHDGEVSGAEVCLYDIWYLLTQYSQDPLVTRLVDTRVFYILPKINPDGSDAYLQKPGTPVDADYIQVDDDADGRLDEDPAEDLNGDGQITLMRIRDEKGSFKTSPEDPRLMVRRKIDEPGEWRIIGEEGMDNDKDGRINEDPPGKSRTVSNRNYPAYWAPEWIQRNAGPYPLSEPEARAQIDFILAHPNIAGIQAHHTHSGVILRPFCNLGDEHIPAFDMRNFEAIGAVGTEITGYPVLSVYNDFTTDKSNPRHGVFVDWAYDHFGALALTTEIWKAPGETGKSVFEGRDDKIAMEWNDKNLAGRAFINWSPYDHPQYGEIEIGGWSENFFVQNPPPKYAEAEWKKNCLFELKHAEMLPCLAIAALEVESLGDGLFRITANVENQGFLPTQVTQKAIDHGLARPVLAEIDLEGVELLYGKKTTNLGHIPGNGPAGSSVFGPPSSRVTANQKSAQWLVRTNGNNPAVTVTVSSPKAGMAAEHVLLKKE
jgi:murein tripeptide amidase MpaA